VEVLEPKGYLITMQAEDFESGTLMKTPRKTASREHTVKGIGEANYVLNLTEDISNPSIRVRYTKGKSASDVVLYVDGRRQSTMRMVGEGSLGEYEMTQEIRLSHALPMGSHTITLEVQSATDELELDYFVIHNQAENPSR
jgi:hypothetical protein